MNDWKEYNLGDIADITSSKRIYFSDYVTSGIPFYRSKEIIEKASGMAINTELFIEPERYSEIKEKFGAPSNGDILISAVGERAGIPYCVNNDGDFYFKDGNLIWFRRFRKDISPEFLVYYFKSFVGQHSLESTMIGSAQKALTIIGLKGLKVKFPSFATQITISSILTSLDDKIDLLHCQNKTLEQLAETLFRQWFVEEADESWKEITLSEIAEHLKGNINPSKNPDKLYKHYSLPSFDELKEPVIEIGKDILSNKYKAVSNSILVSKLNPRTPRIWMLFGRIDEDECICSTEFQVVKPKNNMWLGFIYCFLKSNQVTQELTGASGGTSGSHQRINPQDIFNLTLLKPSEILVERFDKITNEYWKKIKNNQTQILTLTQLRDTLLPKLMSGEVRVKLNN